MTLNSDRLRKFVKLFSCERYALRTVLLGVLALACAVAAPLSAKGEEGTCNSFLGTVDGNWFTAGNWSLGTVPTVTDDVLIANKAVTAEGKISAHTLTIQGAEASLTIGNTSHSLNVGATIAGDLFVTNSAKLYVYAGELADYSTIFTNRTQAYHALYTNANIIAIGGKFTVGAGSTVYPSNAKISGTPVFFKATGDIFVEEGATFDTRKLGWAFFKPSGTAPKGTTTICDGASYYTLATAPGRSWSNGAGYGGKGHNSSAAYGFAYAPFLSGSPAGSQAKDNETTCSVNTRGSGSISLLSKGIVTVAGTLNADAKGYNATDASGGGIWVAGHEVFLRSSAVLSANGGAQVDGSASGGGGGRIAVVQGLSFSELDDLAAGVTTGYESCNLTNAGITVTRGIRANRTWKNADGTKMLVNAVNRCAVVTVGGADVVAEGFEYGEWRYPVGPYTFTAPMKATDANDPSIGYTCYGCIVSNATGEVTRSFSNRCTVDITDVKEPWTVTWLWGTREDVLAIDGLPAEGVDLSTPASGIMSTVAAGDVIKASVCARWTNETVGVIRACAGWKIYDISGTVVAQGEGNICSYTHPTPSAYRHLEWQWETLEQPNTFTGVKSRDWFDAANWTANAVPTANDDAVIDDKPVVAEREIAVRNLTVNGAYGSLTFGNSDYSVRAAANIAGDLTVTGQAKLYVYASELPDYSSVFTNNAQASHALYTNANVIAIGGTMTVKDGATVYPSNAKITGTPVFFKAGNIVVGTNGTFDTRKIGWAWINATKPTGAHVAYNNSTFWTLAMGPGWSWTGAAGYGGKGDEGGAIYGSVYGFDYAPFLSGSPGGNSSASASAFEGARASGSICLLATNVATIAGTLNADALGYSATDASGGGIWVAGRQVFLRPSSVLTAKGGGSGTQGGGGGGRIAVLQGFTADEIDVLATGSKDGCEERNFTRSNVSVLRGLTSGKNWTNADGTKKLVNKTDAFAEVTVASAVPVPSEQLVCDKWLYPVGSYTFEAPLRLTSAEEPARELMCYGYVISNAVCEVARGPLNHFTVELNAQDAPYTVTWQWGESENLFVVDGRPRPGAAVAVFPAYGIYEGLSDGKSIVCTAPATWTSDDGEVTATCTGWKVYDITENVISQGEGNLCRYVHATPAAYRRLAWEWQVVKTPRVANAFTGENGGDWFTAGNWSDGKVPTENDDVLIEGKNVVAEGKIAARFLTVRGASAALTLGKSDHSLNVGATIASNFVVTAGAVLRVYAGELPDYSTIFADKTKAYYALYTNANVIAVGGSFTVGAYAKVYPSNAKLSGTPVFFKVAGDVTVEEEAVFDTRKLGWRHGSGTVPSGALTESTGWSLAGGMGYSWTKGAGYGGAGAGGSGSWGLAYGYAYAAFLSGSPGGVASGSEANWNNARGSGSICLLSKRTVNVAGTLNADALGSSSSCSSGGGIWLVGRQVFLMDTAKLTANGLNGANNRPSGAGGRIAIVQNATEAELDSLAQGVTAGFDAVDISSANVTVKNGYYSTSYAGAGTKKLVNVANQCAVVTIGGGDVVAPGLTYGEWRYPVGSYTFTVPMRAYDSNDMGRSYVCYGCVISNAAGEVTRSGSTRCTVELSSAMSPWTVTWQWGRSEDVLAVDGAPAEGAELYAWPRLGVREAMVAGRSVKCEIQAAWTNLDGRVVATCTGWKLFDIDENLVDQGSGNTCAYVHPTPSDYRRLVWQWTTAEVSTKVFKGAHGGDWFDTKNWADGKLPTKDDDVLIDNIAVVAEGSIAARRLTLQGGDASLTIGKSDHSLNISANIASNLTITGGAKLYVYAGELPDYTTIFTNYTQAYHALYTNANIIAIGGKFSVGNGSVVYPANAIASGTPVFFKVKGNVAVEEGATFDTRKRGWGWMRTDSIPKGCYVSFANAKYGKNIWSLCRGAGFSWVSGGGYGGRTVWGNKYYGWDYGYANAPFLSGGPGGATEGTTDAQLAGGRGSGSICILANGDVRIGGQLLATGTGSISSMASGGGIWLAGRNVNLAATAVLNADGGSSSSSTCPPGGGGRIAVVRGLTEADWDVLSTGGTVSGSEVSNLTHPGASVVATPNAVAGTSNLIGLPNAYVAVEVRGNPIEAEGVEYGTATYCVGENVFSAPEKTVDPANPNSTYYACAGYVVSNVVGEVSHGQGNAVAVNLEADKGPYSVTWLWGAREVILRVETPGAGMGTLAVNGAAQSGDVYAWVEIGSPLAVSVAPASGKAFNCWLGDVPRGSERSTSLAWSSVTQPLALRPIVYTVGEAVDCTWIADRSGSYYEAANWVGGVIPTPVDNVVISSGVCTVQGPLSAGSLTMGGSAQLKVGGADIVKIAGDLLAGGTAQLTVQARAIDETHDFATGTTLVTIGGNLILTDNAVLRPLCDAWTGGANVFEVGKWFKVGPNATVNANEAGWGWREYSGLASSAANVTTAVPGAKLETQALEPGSGKTRGGTMASYGFANAPYWPGSPNGACSASSLTRGGGVVRVHAGDTRVEGVIDASGNTTSVQSGSSGGSIWLTSGRFFFGDAAVLRAKGGKSSVNASKGGGGRIALGTRLWGNQRASLTSVGWCDRKARELSRFAGVFPSVTVDVSKGDGSTAETAQDGSFKYYPTPKPTYITVR